MAGIFLLIVLYIALLIHLKPALKIKKSTKTSLNPRTQQKSSEKKPFETHLQPIMPVENKETVEEMPTSIETPKEMEAEIETSKEPVPPPPPPREVSKTNDPIIQKNEETAKKSGPPGCSYYLGYIGELPKNTPIPDECLACLKLMECLIKRSTNSKT